MLAILQFLIVEESLPAPAFANMTARLRQMSGQ
jgi:hypothetical protein